MIIDARWTVIFLRPRTIESQTYYGVGIKDGFVFYDVSYLGALLRAIAHEAGHEIGPLGVPLGPATPRRTDLHERVRVRSVGRDD